MARLKALLDDIRFTQYRLSCVSASDTICRQAILSRLSTLETLRTQYQEVN